MLPNYKDGSIVNLMSSITRHFGANPKYKSLKIMPKINTKHVLMLIIDGLGYEYLRKRKDSFMCKNMIGKFTSVFPSTTAAAVTAYFTGVPVQQHAITGWYVNFKELGCVCVPLPYSARYGAPLITNPKMIFEHKSVFDTVNALGYMVKPKEYVDSAYSYCIGGKAKRYGYKSLNHMFSQIKKILRKNTRKKLIIAYWPMLDGLGHHNGIASKEVLQHFYELDKKIEEFSKALKNTTLMICSDHGMLDCETIYAPKALQDCLSAPLCGDSRTVYCYVQHSRKKEFENFVKNKMKKYCKLYKSEQLVKKGYFGLDKPNRKLHARIGDYIIIMKHNYALRDRLLGEEKTPFVGFHSGLSKEEMLVPLIFVER